jgi:dephospho-CoA kinase
MSGTGKSTIIGRLRARGFRAVDADEPGWSEYRNVGAGAREWVWREDRIAELLSSRDETLFLSGCASNQAQFYGRFDHIVLLSAPSSVLAERLASRTTNAYGKRPEELAEVMENRRTIEPLLRTRATLEIDTRAPIDEVLSAVLQLVKIDPA